MSEIYFPIVIVLLASVFQGTFGLGMKFVNFCLAILKMMFYKISIRF